MLHIIIGPPGSGKSTGVAQRIAKELEDGYISSVILGRDTIRKEIFKLEDSTLNTHYKCTKEELNAKEALVTREFNKQLAQYKEEGYHIIVDNTNLSMKYINDIVRHAGFTAEDVYLYDACYEQTLGVIDLIDRDSKREATVGKEVIYNMYYKYLKLLISGNFTIYSNNLKNSTKDVIYYNKVMESIDYLIDNWDKKPKGILNNLNYIKGYLTISFELQLDEKPDPDGDFPF